MCLQDILYITIYYMKYEIFHFTDKGGIEPCGIIIIKGQSFDFKTEKPELASLLNQVKKRGYVEHSHGERISEARPGDNEFIMALEEYLGNYRIRKSQQ